MGRKSTINFKVTVDPKAPIIPKTPSQEAEEFRAMIEAYKEQNPVKYAMKEKSLLAKLERLEAPLKKEAKKEDSVE